MMGKTRTPPQSSKAAPESEAGPNRLGSQTLFRGLDVIEVVAMGPVALGELAQRLELTRSTTHRLASALVSRRYLAFTPGDGYRLGPKLLELGYKVREELDLRRVASRHLQRLALISEDTVHLGVLDRGRALYLEKIPGQRRISISSRVGELQPVCSTGLGKALILDESEDSWADHFRAEKSVLRTQISQAEWIARMRNYARWGFTYDLEENEDQIRCVAAPIRDVGGGIIGGISVSSAAQYMNDQRMQTLSKDVVETARRISQDLGWVGQEPTEQVVRVIPERVAVAASSAASNRRAKVAAPRRRARS